MFFELSTDIYSLITIFVCLILSAVFSASETAISSIGSIRAKHLLDTNKGATGPLHTWVKYPHHLLTTILLFNNLVNILASVLTAALTAKYFQNNAIGIATGITTLLILIFGEIVPKSFAKIYSEYLSMIALRFIHTLYIIFYPIVWVFAELAYIISKSLGGNRKTHTPLITEDEIEYLINEGDEASEIEHTKRDMISSVFEFHETRVREIMTPRTDLIAMDIDESSLSKAIKLVLESGHSRIPVYRDSIDHIIGIVLAKDLLSLTLSQETPNIQTFESTLRKAFFVPESKAIMDVFRDLRNSKNHLAIVVDEYGGTAGVVTMEDILEEIVGDIQDEHDKEEEDIIKINDRIYDVSGSMNLADFFSHFKDSKPEDEVEKLSSEFDTIGGWVTDMIGELPKAGQKIRQHPFEMEVAKTAHHRIKRVKVKLIDDHNEPTNLPN